METIRWDPNKTQTMMYEDNFLILKDDFTLPGFTLIRVYKTLRERRQLGFVTLNGNLAVSGWVGLAYDR